MECHVGKNMKTPWRLVVFHVHSMEYSTWNYTESPSSFCVLPTWNSLENLPCNEFLESFPRNSTEYKTGTSKMQDRRKQALPDKQKIYVAIISLTFIARYLTVDNCSL